MADAILVAVPSEAPGGLQAVPSAHFGHCAAYTVAKIENGKITGSQIVNNPGHEHGGCVEPVKQLAKDGVTVLLAGGMGQRPLQAMREAGIKVYHSVDAPTCQSALEDYLAGKLREFGPDLLCKGCHGH